MTQHLLWCHTQIEYARHYIIFFLLSILLPFPFLLSFYCGWVLALGMFLLLAKREKKGKKRVKKEEKSKEEEREENVLLSLHSPYFVVVIPPSLPLSLSHTTSS